MPAETPHPGDPGASAATADRVARPTRRRILAAAGWLTLAGVLIAAPAATLLRTAPTFRLSAQTEEVRIHTGRGTPTSALPFRRVLLLDGRDTVPFDNVGVELGDSVLVRVHRMSPDAFTIVLESSLPGRGAGTLNVGRRIVRQLDSLAVLRVPIAEGGMGGAIQFPFRARRVEVGNETDFATSGRTALLRSGEVTLTDETLFGAEFQSGSHTLRTGDAFVVPTPGHAAASFGAGLVLMDGTPGITLRFDIRARQARITSDAYEERLRTPYLDRIRHDPFVALAWALFLFLVLQPVGSLVADRLKKRVEPFLDRP